MEKVNTEKLLIEAYRKALEENYRLKEKVKNIELILLCSELTEEDRYNIIKSMFLMSDKGVIKQ